MTMHDLTLMIIIIRSSREMVHEELHACVVRSFAGASSIVKAKILQAHNLALYGSALRNISSSSQDFEANLVCSEAHSHSHSYVIVLLVLAIYVCLRHFYILLLLRLPYLRVYIIFSEASQLAQTFAGSTIFLNHAIYTKDYLLGDRLCSDVIRDYMHAG